jgi:hypothetical protein
MGHMKEYERRIRGGGDDAIAAVSELWESRENILFDITEAFTKARWIPVSERLPEENVSVLVFTKDGKFDRAGMHVAILDEDGEWYPSHGDGYMFPVVTHWMPLPEPPNDPTAVR